MSCDVRDVTRFESMHHDLLIMQGIVSIKQFESHLNTAINNNSQEFEFHHAYTGEGLLNAQRMARTISKLELLIYFVFPPHPRKFSLLNYSYWSLHFD